MMEANIIQNQGYWFVLRDEQSNILFNGTNNVPIQNSQTGETRYIIEATEEDRQFLQLTDSTIQPHEIICETSEKYKKTEEFWDRNKVKLLLSLCLENRFFVTSPKEEGIWDEIAYMVGNTPDECHKKFRNLKRTYIRLLRNKRQGKEIKWVHFNLCEEIFKYYKPLPPMLEVWDDESIRKLLSLYLDNVGRFNDSETIKKDIWRDIAGALGKSGYSCYQKFKNLKRSYFTWLEKNRDGTRTLKWPYHHYFDRILYNANNGNIRWGADKIKRLLDVYTQISHKFQSKRYQKKELWKEIGDIVGESATACDRKFRNLKQTYLKLKFKTKNKNGIKWRYFKDFEIIYGYGNQSCMEASPQHVSRTQKDCVRDLLNFYIENKERFKNPAIKNRNVWKKIASKLYLSPEECDKKFRNLKQTYVRLLEKNDSTGKYSNWPYFSYFQIIYDNNVNKCSNVNKSDIKEYDLSEIQGLTRKVQERRDNDKKFDKLLKVAEESNIIQRERNRILKELLDRKK